MDAPNAWIEGRKSPICDVPPLVFGSMPNDGGYLSDWGDEQKDAICSANPEAKSLFRRFLGASEFINKKFPAGVVSDIAIEIQKLSGFDSYEMEVENAKN